MAFLIDRFLLFIAENILEQAQNELLGDEKKARQDLIELYAQLESGRISEEEFEKKEQELVERLEQIESYREGSDEAA